MRIPRRFIVLFLFLAGGGNLFANTLSVETDYRLRGISYTDIDFDKTTSTDAASFYSQRLRLSIRGNFAQGIEIGSRITALGVVGSSSTVFPVPYPNTGFSPYIENAYIKIPSIADQPIDLIIGKQELTYGSGLIIADNGLGFNAIRIIGRYRIPLPLTVDIFTAKTKENFGPESDGDLYGGMGSVLWKDHLIEAGYFEERDFSGTPYFRGPSNAFATEAIVKQFYDARITHKDAISSYGFEIAKQGGYVKRDDDAVINMEGMGFIASGELIGERTRLGKVSAHSLLAVFTGNENPLAFENDTSFSPTYTRRFDGLERLGYGNLFAATPTDSFFTLPAQYSGINTLNLGAHFSPLFGLTMGADYFLYSASKAPKGSPPASGFERLFGAEFALGVELDLFVRFVPSRFFETQFSYSRYTPPKFEVFWPKTDPATRYELEIVARF